jgi:hypothetical protein
MLAPDFCVELRQTIATTKKACPSWQNDESHSYCPGKEEPQRFDSLVEERNGVVRRYIKGTRPPACLPEFTLTFIHITNLLIDLFDSPT